MRFLISIFILFFAIGASADGIYNVGFTVLDLSLPKSKTPLTVAVWYPTKALPEDFRYGGKIKANASRDTPSDSSAAPYPLLVFAHGYAGSGLGHVFLSEPLAARGWIVVAPDFHDGYSAVRIREGQLEEYDRAGLRREAAKITNSGPEDRAELEYRLDEMQVAIDGILDSKLFGSLIDRNRIAVGGHSLGGFTALGVSGTIPARHDKRIKALLLYSTGAGGYLFRESELARIKIPSMYMLGADEKTERRGAERMGDLAEKVFRNLSPPKFFLEIEGAEHGSFNNWYKGGLLKLFIGGNDKQFDIITRYSIAFLERYIKGDRSTEVQLGRQEPQLTRYDRETSVKATVTPVPFSVQKSGQE